MSAIARRVAGNDKPSRRGPPPPGFAARQAAVTAISLVLDRGRSLDEAFEQAQRAAPEPAAERDRGLARLITLTVLRRKGELEHIIGSFLDKPLPAKTGRLQAILLAGAAQLLILETPAHAAISLAVEQARADAQARRFDRLVNALLRRVSREGAALLGALDGPRLNIPAWLYARWERTYGDATAHAIAEASLREAALDLTVMGEPDAWAGPLGGTVLATGSVRLRPSGRVNDLAGYDEGAWWVQDAGAALPARLFGNVSGLEIADMCASPGGKAAQLAAGGARVTAVDVSQARLDRLTENLTRLKLDATLVAADAATWSPGRTFDAVLLDAPCTSTGTIRRRPDILYVKRESDVAKLADTQARLLEAAAKIVKPGGLLVYCTCSLEPEEGAQQIERFLGLHADFRRGAVEAGEIGVPAQWITADGDLRTLPSHLTLESPGMSGMDGFFAARLVRAA